MLHRVSASHWQNGSNDTGRYYTGMRMPAACLIAVLVGGLSIVGQSPAPQPGTGRNVGSMSELMIDVLYPASDAVFYIETRTPKNDVEWTEVQGKTLVLAESANLLMLPGRARDNDRWMADAKLLLD